MSKSFPKKFLSLVVLACLFVTNIIYADNVVVGSAPTTAGRTMDPNANTPYLQNQYSGPGLLPNSSVTYNTPIQVQGTNTSDNYNAVSGMTYASTTADTGPTVQVITRPSVHNAQNNQSSRTSSQVIDNGALTSQLRNDSTSDTGPTVHEIYAPTAGGELISSNYGDSYSGPGATGIETLSNYDVPEQTTSYQNYIQDTGVIIYTTNDFIRAPKPNIVAPAALVVNATTRQIYFSKGGLNPFYPAALANLVTASILISSRGIDDVLAVSATAVTGLESGANTAGLRAGDTITVRDAIGAMFVKSCCDVANVVAENVAGNTANFVALMNQTVRSWGCVGTNFTNPTGLNNNNQVTTTYDMAIIMDKVTSDPVLKLFLVQPAYVLPATIHRGSMTLKSSNQLITPGNKNYYTGISASRVGYTSKAKYTVASELDYNGQRLIAIVLNANGSQWTDSIKLLNFAKVASLEAGNNGVTYNTVLTVANTVDTQTMAATNFAANLAAMTAANQVVNSTNALAYQLPTANQVATFGNQVTNNTAFASIGDAQGTWQKDNKGWYFIKTNGQSATNEWIKQNGKMYCVDSTGYMITGWRQMSNGKMYYFDPTSGELRHNTWVNVSTGAYYLQDDGTLAKANPGSTMNINTSVGTYTIDENGKALAKVG